MQIKIVAVEVSTAKSKSGKDYQVVEATYKNMSFVGKPETKRGEGTHATFYNHDHVGARITEKALTRLRFSKEIIKNT